MKIIAGLGNPGMEYAQTRHNAGFEAVNAFARRHKAAFTRGPKCFMSELNTGGEKVVLVKPMTYMNNSGEAVSAVLRRFRAGAGELIVVYDDMDLELGRLRIREQGSSGGHNGMKSVIALCGTQDFCRLRIGIGRGGQAVGHVLSKFSPDEKPVIREAYDRAADALDAILEHGISYAMNMYNR